MGWAAANRDPKFFESPTKLRIDRQRSYHMTFGYGVHSCPGAMPARMELRVLLEVLLRRVPDLRVVMDRTAYQFGGGDYSLISALPVTFTPGLPERQAEAK